MKPVWQFIKTQKSYDLHSFVLGIFVALLPAAAGILLLGVSGWFITSAALAGLSGVFLNIFAPSAIIRALAIIRTAGRYGERMLTHDATFRFLGNLRNRLFSAVAENAVGRQRSGLVLNRLTADIEALDTVYLRLVVPIVLCIVVATFLLLVWAGSSGLVLLAGLGFLAGWALLAWKSLSNSDRKTARRADAASDAMRLRAADLAAGRRDLAIYGGLDKAAEGITRASEQLRSVEDGLERRSVRLSAYSNLIGQAFLATMLFACAWGVAEETISLPYAVGLLLAVMALPEIVSMMLPGLANLPRTALAATRTMSATGAAKKGKQQVADPEKRTEENPGTGPVLTFKNVTFTYPGASRPVLDNLSFSIERGETLAIAGRSGCGKSTIAALAARLRVSGSGSIRINGTDISDYGEIDLRRAVSVLSQRPYLFNDTVAANLRIADPDAIDTKLWRALERAELADRIAESADGLKTVLGEGGLGLSGGEQRRLALARAFLTRPALFILDEMTEGLDEKTGSDVLSSFMEFRTDEAVLMIAHKKRELEVADRIVNLTDTTAN